MNEHQIVSAVERTAKLPDYEHARTAVQATLSVLGERLSGGEPKDLASQLPPTLADALPDTGRGDPFDLEEFYRLVAVREGDGCTPKQARQHARAVMSVMQAAVSPGEFNDIVQQLPNEYADLFGSAPRLH